MTTPIDPMAAVKLLRDALLQITFEGPGRAVSIATKALAATASIEQPASEEVACGAGNCPAPSCLEL